MPPAARKTTVLTAPRTVVSERLFRPHANIQLFIQHWWSCQSECALPHRFRKQRRYVCDWRDGNGPFPADPNAYLSTAAGKLADSIKSLQLAGARYIIVPDTAFSFPTNDPTAQTEQKFYSTTLWSDLAARGVNFIPADFNSVRQAIAANKSAFGFTNIGTGAGQTACEKPDQTKFPFITTAWASLVFANFSLSKLTPGADKFDLFADDQHLTTAGQKIEADYYYSLLTAPSEISMLAETAIKTRIQVTADIQTQIDLSQVASRAARRQRLGERRHQLADHRQLSRHGQ